VINAASIILGDKAAASRPTSHRAGAPNLRSSRHAAGLAAVNRFRLMRAGREQVIARNYSARAGPGLYCRVLAGALGQLAPSL